MYICGWFNLFLSYVCVFPSNCDILFYPGYDCIYIHLAITHPDSSLCEVGPCRNLLPGCHIWVSVPGKGGFELLQLLWGEVGPLSPLAFLLFVLFSSILRFHFGVVSRVWKWEETWYHENRKYIRAFGQMSKFRGLGGPYLDNVHIYYFFLKKSFPNKFLRNYALGRTTIGWGDLLLYRAVEGFGQLYLIYFWTS